MNPNDSEADVQAALSCRDYARHVLEQPEMTDAEADHILWEFTPFPMVQGAVGLAPHLARYRVALELRRAAHNPTARLSGHSGVSVRWLERRADEIERGAS